METLIFPKIKGCGAGSDSKLYCDDSDVAYIHVSNIVEYPNVNLYHLMSKVTSHEDFEPRRKSELDKLFGKPFYKGQSLWQEVGKLMGYKSDCYYRGDNFLAANYGKAASLIHFYFKVGTTQEEVFQTLQAIADKLSI